MVIPPVLQLHRKRLNPDDVGIKYGVRVTKPLKTLIDLVKGDHVPRKYLHEAVAQAIEQQIILPSEIARADLTAKERKLLQSFIGETAK
jgi:hypothetical protein